MAILDVRRERNPRKPNGTAEGRHERCSSKRSYKDLDRKRVINHIAAEIRIMTVRLGTLVCSRRARQQRIAPRLCRSDPIVLPAAPCVPVYRVEELALNPRRAAIIRYDNRCGRFGYPPQLRRAAGDKGEGPVP